MKSTIAAEPVVVEIDSTRRRDMPEEVLDGRLGQIFQSRMQGCCLAYAWPSLLVIAGASPLMTSGRMRANLYACTVGAVGSGKSAIFERACHALGCDSSDAIILRAKYGSAEGLMKHLDDTKASIAVLYPDELRHLLEKATIDRSSFPTILTTAYYHDRQQGGTKNRRDQFSVDCRLSIAGGVVEEQFGECFGAVSVGGLYDRFTFGLCPLPYAYQWRPSEVSYDKIESYPPDVAASVWDERNQWIHDGISPRVAEIALKCAYICAAVDSRRDLLASQLRPALAMARYQMKFRSLMRPNPGQNPIAQCAVAITTWLEQNSPGGWVRRWELSKGVHSERMGPAIFNQTLMHLGMNDEIEVDAKQKRVRLLRWQSGENRGENGEK